MKSLKNCFKMGVALIVLIFASGVSFANAFVTEYSYTIYNEAGFFSGIWHGLLAPWSLVARWFNSDFVMYAIPNTGWFYDAGFLLGVVGSIPIGWAASILSALAHIFL